MKITIGTVEDSRTVRASDSPSSLRQMEVEQQQVDRLVSHQLEYLLAGTGDRHSKVILFQILAQQIAQRRVVIDRQYMGRYRGQLVGSTSSPGTPSHSVVEEHAGLEAW